MVDTLPWHDDALLAGSDGRDEPLSEPERASNWDDDHWLRVDAEARYFGSGK
jgi:hypothetical protein